MKNIIIIGTLLGVLVLSGCLRIGGGNFNSPTSTTYNIGGTFTTGQSVYAIFTGTEVNKSSDYGSITINGNISSNISKNIVGPKIIESQKIKRIDIGEKLRKDTKEIVLEKNINKNLSNISRSTSNNLIVGTTVEEFNVEVTDNLSTFDYTDATISAKLIGQNVKVGEKTLNIWLDNSYSDTTEGIKLGAEFLNGNNTSDIYHWITNIFGEEWGTTGYSNLISESETIDILLTDLNENYVTTNFVMGYFYSRDTFKASSYSKSNEKNMFYIDMRLLNGDFKYSTDTTLTENDKNEMKQDIYSTLAHEFVHMINWYQKDILQLKLNSYTESWLNEMLAMMGEDLVDDKITVDGDHGVLGSKGRIASFNWNNNIEINDHDIYYDIEDYNIGAVYGLYLTRAYAYNDLSFLSNIMHNNKSGVEAIDYALAQKGVNKTFIDTIKDFGKAVILSSAEGGTSGDSTIYMNRVIDDLNGYKFEPINIFTYSDFYYKATEAGFKGGANTYAELRGKGDTNITESWSFTLPVGVGVQLVVKNSDGSFNVSKTNELNNQK